MRSSSTARSRTTSTDGFLRNSRLIILRFRFSSARKAITSRAAFEPRSAGGFRPAGTGFDLFNNLSFVFADGFQICVDLIGATEVEGDDGVHVRQGDGRVLLVDLFGSGAFVESIDERQESDPSARHSADTVGVKTERRRNGLYINAHHDVPIITTHLPSRGHLIAFRAERP